MIVQSTNGASKPAEPIFSSQRNAMPVWQSHSGGALAPRKFACLHKQPGRRANRGRFDATYILPRETPWNPLSRLRGIRRRALKEIRN